MPKMKTKASAKKRFGVTGSGKVKFKKAFARHMMRNKPKKMKRQARGTDIMADGDAKKVLSYFLPYQSRKKKTKASCGTDACSTTDKKENA